MYLSFIFLRYTSYNDGRTSANYTDASKYSMFSPAFRPSRGASGGSAHTSPRSPWPPSSPAPYGTASWAHERAQTPRSELRLKCQTLHMNVDNCMTSPRRAGSAVVDTGSYSRPGYGSEWLTQTQLASRQHARQMREIAAQSPRQYSYLLRTPPSTPRSPRPDKTRKRPNISLKHLLTAVMSRTPAVNAGIRRNYVCFKLHDDRNAPKMAPPSPVSDNEGHEPVGNALTMSDHFGVAISRTCSADMSVEVESFSIGAGVPTRESPDMTRSQRSVRFNVSTHVREYQPTVPVAV